MQVRFWAVFVGCSALWAASLAVARSTPLVNNTALDSTQASNQESNLGDLTADSLRDAAHADIAILPATELRSVTVPAGHVDSQQVVDSLRAASDDSDTVVLLQLSGAQILKALNHGLSRLPASYAGFLQISGLRVTYSTDSHRATVASAILPNGSALSADRTYTVATSRLLADGAVGYFEVWSKSDISRDTGVPLSKALVDYATAHQPLDYHVQGRITAR
ncbi:MAG TPA: 5'-nucleotidase [Capsulimonadaceae bacterium]|nr:5'-nucleotidase [Capsulimonadaceae bacterium]